EAGLPVAGRLQRRRVVGGLARVDGRGAGLVQREPGKRVLAERQQIGQLADGREAGAPDQLDGNAALEAAQVQLHELREAGEVRHHQDGLVLELADEGEDLGVLRREELYGAS